MKRCFSADHFGYVSGAGCIGREAMRFRYDMLMGSFGGEVDDNEE